MGPQSLPVEFNLTFPESPPEADPQGPVRTATRVGGCTFHGESATTGSPAVRSVRGKVTCGLRAGGVTALDVVGRLADRGIPAAARAPVLLRPFDWGGLFTVLSDRGWSRRGQSRVISVGSVAIQSAPHPTRLETRTKESNMCASHGVLRNLKAQ